MRILIAEDNEHKFEKIKNCLELNFNNLEIKRCVNAKEVILELMHNEYEFLIQDMQMPIRSDSLINVTAGLYVHGQLERRQIKIKTIFCSSEDVSFLNPYSCLNYPESVLFQYNGSDWKDDLIEKMRNHR